MKCVVILKEYQPKGSASCRQRLHRHVQLGLRPGWKHDTAIATHPGSGGFCYSFVRQAPPSGYPKTKPVKIAD